MSEIISHTPIWVFVLFFVLIVLGLLQLKDRYISFNRLVILPIIMVCLSFYSTISAFGLDIKSSFCCFIGLVIAVLLNMFFKLPRNSTYNKVEEIFFIKGSIIPFILIMSIFFIKYFVGVVIAMQLVILNDLLFICIISFIYGILSGFFLGRIVFLLNLKK